jgi:hypothetical protein
MSNAVHIQINGLPETLKLAAFTGAAEALRHHAELIEGAAQDETFTPANVAAWLRQCADGYDGGESEAEA